MSEAEYTHTGELQPFIDSALVSHPYHLECCPSTDNISTKGKVQACHYIRCYASMSTVANSSGQPCIYFLLLSPYQLFTAAARHAVYHKVKIHH